MLNRLATFYTMPYFDVGVRLDADGAGGVNVMAGASSLSSAGLSSLLSRGVYDMQGVWTRGRCAIQTPKSTGARSEHYLRGVDEDKPAVISLNMLFAALAVNDFLARLHPYRNQPSAEYAYGCKLVECDSMSRRRERRARC